MLVAAAVLILLGVLGFELFSDNLTKPQLSVSVTPSKIDFGRIRNDQVHSVDITAENDGDSDFAIDGLELSCGCMVSDFQKRVLKPGQSYSVEITLSPRPTGPGSQMGRFVCTPELYEKGMFQIEYFVLKRSHFLNANRNLGVIWTKATEWPMKIAFELANFPVGIVPTPVARLSATDYGPFEAALASESKFGNGESLVLMLELKNQDTAGRFDVRLEVEVSNGTDEFTYELRLHGVLALDTPPEELARSAGL